MDNTAYGKSRILQLVDQLSQIQDGGSFQKWANLQHHSTHARNLLRFTSSAAITETRGILYNTQHTDRGWIGGVGEIIGFLQFLRQAIAKKLSGYLAQKWGLTGSLPATTHISLKMAPTSRSTGEPMTAEKMRTPGIMP
jgi:hypothetical protein